MRKLILIFGLITAALLAQQNAHNLMLGMVDAPNTPTDSPGGGTYGSTQSVTLSDPTASIILYTIDGSTPACPATGTLYTGAISVAVTTTIKAVGCNGVTGGGVLTSVYTISTGSNVTLVSGQAVPGAWSNTCVLPSTVASGNTVLAFITYAEATGPALTIADDKGNNYTGLTAATVASSNYAHLFSQIFYFVNATNAPKTLTISWGSPGQPAGAWEFGCAEITTSVLDSSAQTNGSSATPSAGSITPAGSGEFVIAVSIIDDNRGAGNTFAVGSGYTSLLLGGGGSREYGQEYQHVTGSGATTGDFTNGGFTGTWVASMAFFK